MKGCQYPPPQAASPTWLPPPQAPLYLLPGFAYLFPRPYLLHAFTTSGFTSFPSSQVPPPQTLTSRSSPPSALPHSHLLPRPSPLVPLHHQHCLIRTSSPGPHLSFLSTTSSASFIRTATASLAISSLRGRSPSTLSTTTMRDCLKTISARKGYVFSLRM